VYQYPLYQVLVSFTMSGQYSLYFSSGQLGNFLSLYPNSAQELGISYISVIFLLVNILPTSANIISCLILRLLEGWGRMVRILSIIWVQLSQQGHFFPLHLEYPLNCMALTHSASHSGL